MKFIDLFAAKLSALRELDEDSKTLGELYFLRLQGFPDWAFDQAQEVNSNSQLYKQAGNSVTVNVIAAIARELK